ncbi:unnamed protein product [Rhodiola kirilowii]
MPKKKGNRGKKPTRGKTEQREHTQKSKCSVGSDEFSNLSIFQDDLLEQILVYLPIESIIRAGLVCKKWREITTSKRFLWNASQTVQQKPWYFMCVNNYFTPTSSTWYAYDPILQKYQGGDFLDMMKSHMSFDSSDGLVCFVKDNEIHVCNPITKEHKKLHEPPRTFLPRYTHYLRSSYSHNSRLINIWVNQRLQIYNVSVLYYEEEEGARMNREFSFQVYDSATMKWATSQPEILIGWKLHRKSVICNGVLYFLIYPTGAIDEPGVENLHIGFGIWLLKGKDWQEISRITHPCIYDSYRFFDSSGADDLIYIHNKVDPQLVVFDMKLKQWTCCQKCVPTGFCMTTGFCVNTGFYLATGFCFQPRLDISP